MNNNPESVEIPKYGVSNLRTYLVGTWKLTREIEDRLTGDRGHVIGRVTFDPVGFDLVGREKGMLTYRLHCGIVTRCYYFSFPTDKASNVHFENGGFFHCLDLSAGHCVVQHFCGADQYHAKFWSESVDLWNSVWRVRGPDKDHGIVSHFEREDIPPG